MLEILLNSNNTVLDDNILNNNKNTVINSRMDEKDDLKLSEEYFDQLKSRG